MSDKSILIVDDVEINIKLATAVLKTEGYHIETAVDGVEALEILESFLPDLILSDLQMPRMDGLELTRTVRRDDRLRDIPMIAWTAFSMKATEREALAAGFDAYITKPTDAATLRGRVRQLLPAA